MHWQCWHLLKEPQLKNLKILAFALVVGMTMLSQPTSSAARANGPSASGHGNLTVGGELRTFSFTAVTHKDGSVTGEAELINRASGGKFHLAINCLSVSGIDAVVSGVVTNSDGPTNLLGWTGVFRVTDNGEGANDPPDQISFTFFFPPPTTVSCQSFVPAQFSTVPIEGGNIQVQP